MNQITQETRDKIGTRIIVCSVSGGKDSAAMSLWLHENGIEHRRVFMDTGWEHKLTYEYLRGPLTDKLGAIEEIRAPLLMQDLIRKKGMFPSRVRRFCTQELKIKPMQRYINALSDAGHDCINTVGIRRGESKARSASFEWEFSDGFDCEVWRPLVAWSEQDVIDIHTRNGLAPNPLYLMGASRVGCWPCIHSRKKELAFIADVDPARIDEIRALEGEFVEKARVRYEAKGETFESQGYLTPVFFQTPMRVNGSGECWPIDKMVEWSRTDRGGRQYPLFEDEPEDGCVRWGLCDTSEEKS